MPLPKNSHLARIDEDNKVMSFKCSKCNNTWFEQVILSRFRATFVAPNQRAVSSTKAYPFLRCVKCNHLEQLVTSFDTMDVEFHDLLDTLDEAKKPNPAPTNEIKADEV